MDSIKSVYSLEFLIEIPEQCRIFFLNLKKKKISQKSQGFFAFDLFLFFSSNY